MDDSALVTQKPLSERILQSRLGWGIIAFLGLFFLWTLFVHPALFSEWWGADDFNTLEHRGVLVPAKMLTSYFFSSARPIGTLAAISEHVMLSVFPPFTAGLFIRLLQGIAHVAAATLIGTLLVQWTGRKLAMLTVLPFLVWPFGSEATVWMAAFAYPIAALLSVGGLLLLLRAERFFSARTIMGMVLIFLAPFSNQSAGIAAFVTFLILVALSLSDRAKLRSLVRPLAALAIAYLLAVVVQGALLSLFRESRFSGYLPGTQFAHLRSQLYLTYLYLLSAPYLYPLWVRGVHFLLFLLGLIAVFPFFPARTIIQKILGGIAAVGLIAIMFLALRAPTVFTGMDWVSGRTLYIDPLVMTCALCFILQSRLRPAHSAGIVLLLLTALLIGYYPISTVNARENVIVFQNDLKTLQNLEETARAQGTDQLAVAFQPYRSPPPNPYNLRYIDFGENHYSAFRTQIFGPNFIAHFSSLTLLTDRDSIRRCAAACRFKDPPERSIEWMEDPVKALCFCQ